MTVKTGWASLWPLLWVSLGGPMKVPGTKSSPFGKILADWDKGGEFWGPHF